MAKRPAVSPSRHAGPPVIPPGTTDSPPVQISSTNSQLTTSENLTTDGSSTKSKPEKKQSKSRNGCVTCKAKRLKCDETKPLCQQCHKRGVECGGYKKDFKWRAFEETNFIKSGPARSKKPTSPKSKPTQLQAPACNPLVLGDAVSKDNIPCTISGPAYNLTPPATAGLSVPTYPYNTAFAVQSGYVPDSPVTAAAPSYSDQLSYLSPSHSDDLEFKGAGLDNMSRNDEPGTDPFVTSATTFSGRSPGLIDILAPGTNLNARPPKFPDLSDRKALPTFQPLSITTGDVNQIGVFEDDDVEEIIRQPEPEPPTWVISLPSPTSSSCSTSSDGSGSKLARSIYRQPDFPPGSIEMLMHRFDNHTCGILSIKDGPTENPWRTLVWPMAREAPALHYAIASMAAFHRSREHPTLRMQGVAHVRESVRLLAAGIVHMPTETALATTLALAFSEAWDQPTKNGATHLRGAKILINLALERKKRYPPTPEEFARMKFLINCWIYMDVLSRLNSLDMDDMENYDQITQFLRGPFAVNTEVDPLMGCAHTLFPLIGQAANLVQRVRMSQRNSSDIIAQAVQLKIRIEDWKSSGSFEPLEDQDTEIEHSIQTAEAYRWATLLYLHQAVPEIPSMTTAELADKVLASIAKVPTSSRATIIHFFPLVVAGSEIVRPERRDWIEGRWRAMISRMWIGNVDRCWDVVQEVWKRRDKFEEEQRVKGIQRGFQMNVSVGAASGIGKRKFGLVDGRTGEMVNTASSNPMPNVIPRKKRMAVMNFSGTPTPLQLSTQPSIITTTEQLPEILPFERTVRGSVHWAGVMKDWNWEVLLG